MCHFLSNNKVFCTIFLQKKSILQYYCRHPAFFLFVMLDKLFAFFVKMTESCSLPFAVLFITVFQIYLQGKMLMTKEHIILLKKINKTVFNKTFQI